MHFNSRPSARGDKRAWRNDANCVLISIHAPPRGATPPAQPQIRTACVFQFTPLREGRQVYKSHGFGRTYFNSRPSARGDSPGRGYQLLINISIHAPPRGATAGCITVVAVSSNFNSRPSARGDNSLKSEAVNSLFQFTPLREGRQAFVEFCLKKYAGISIHAPPRGATHQRERFSPSTLFQFTPLREGRR